MTPGAAAVSAAITELVTAMNGQSNMAFLSAEDGQKCHYWTTNPLARRWANGVLGYIGPCDPTGLVPPRTPAYGTGGWLSSPNATAINNSQNHPSGDGITTFANDLTEATKLPLVTFEYAKPGSHSSTWIDNGTANNWKNYADAVRASGKKLNSSDWYQGEDDASAGTTEQGYYDFLGEYHDQQLALAGLTRATAKKLYFGVTLLGPGTTYAPEGNMGAIRRAQLRYIADTEGAYLIAVATDMNLAGGDIHIDNDSQITRGKRAAKSLAAWAKGAPVKWPGPRIGGWGLSGTTATVHTVGGVGPLKDGAGGAGGALKGFRFYSGPNGTGSLVPYTTTSINGADIVFALSGSATSMDYGMANAPFTANVDPAFVVYDSDTLALPLIPCAPMNVTGG
jgi:hypothetical protein